MRDELKFHGGLVCALGVEDIPASVAWYAKTLGFELRFHAKDIGWAEITTCSEGVSIGLSEMADANVRGGATLVMGVDDVDSARAILEAEGVAFDGATVEYPGLVRLATFYDPDGHKLMLYQDMPRDEPSA